MFHGGSILAPALSRFLFGEYRRHVTRSHDVTIKVRPNIRTRMHAAIAQALHGRENAERTLQYHHDHG